MNAAGTTIALYTGERCWNNYCPVIFIMDYITLIFCSLTTMLSKSEFSAVSARIDTLMIDHYFICLSMYLSIVQMIVVNFNTLNASAWS